MTNSKGIVPLVVVCLVVGAFVTWQVRSCATEARKQRKSEQEEKQRAERIRARVAELVSRHKPVIGWAEELDQKNGNLSRWIGPAYFTLHVEDVLVGGKPVLVIGELIDVASLDESNLSLYLKPSDWVYDDRMASSLRFEVACPRAKAMALLSEVRADKASYALGVAVAAILDIESVSRQSTLLSGGDLFVFEEELVFTGHGNCVDVFLLGDIPEVTSDMLPTRMTPAASAGEDD